MIITELIKLWVGLYLAPGDIPCLRELVEGGVKEYVAHSHTHYQEFYIKHRFCTQELDRFWEGDQPMLHKKNDN